MTSIKKRAIITIGAVMIIGVSALIFTHAATGMLGIEPENGTPSGQASTISDSNASGGQALKFSNTPTNCPYTAPVVANKWGAMGYVNYWFYQPDIYQMQHDIDLMNNPATNSDYYIQMDDADIGAGQQYYGLQTTGLVIWSRWNTSDTTNIRAAAGSTVLNGTEVGAEFISLRHSFSSLPSGHYVTRISRQEFDGTGDWFGYYVTFPGQAEVHIGDIRFPRQTVGVPASFHDGGGQWNEFWDNNGSGFFIPPLLKMNIKATANGNVLATHAYGKYSSMPDSDMYLLDSPGNYIHHDIGGTTGRCHPGDVNGALTLW